MEMMRRVLVRVVVVLVVSGMGRCDVDKDKEKCANDLVGLATCLPFVSGESKAPPIDCCTGLKQVLQKSPQCICLLVKDRNDPTLGLKINATLALSLPSHCHSPSPANISDCPALLHLPPNSPDAKVFEDFANTGKKTNATAPAAAASANGSSGKTTTAAATTASDGGGKRRSWWLGGVVVLFTIMVVVHNLPNL